MAFSALPLPAVNCTWKSKLTSEVQMLTLMPVIQSLLKWSLHKKVRSGTYDRCLSIFELYFLFFMKKSVLCYTVCAFFFFFSLNHYTHCLLVNLSFLTTKRHQIFVSKFQSNPLMKTDSPTASQPWEGSNQAQRKYLGGSEAALAKLGHGCTSFFLTLKHWASTLWR